ncbi:uncharacterized protein SCHCODRAFT_02637572 [Schizophyllum commune H4-8]|uniref:uncharacterized protein n=1 Tax=Schizophyllum commune (strain H4-8 / FGSC 9210) TaxID=578458 RepID=UPI00215FD275|nr:uncharacterized protein SCHCODRAFT_02637572 [Schizophyllum commune H4-8]KAI5888744.1 hypothetical protein SCHCODRAFT_02637572 [Schizophyllum commune H4-8]
MTPVPYTATVYPEVTQPSGLADAPMLTAAAVVVGSFTAVGESFTADPSIGPRGCLSMRTVHSRESRQQHKSGRRML